MASASVTRREKKDRRKLAEELGKLNATTDYLKGLQMIEEFGAEKARRDLKVYELNMTFLQNKKSYEEVLALGKDPYKYGHALSAEVAKVLGFVFKELEEYPLARKYYEFVVDSEVEDKDLYKAEVVILTAECERLRLREKLEELFDMVEDVKMGPIENVDEDEDVLEAIPADVDVGSEADVYETEIEASPQEDVDAVEASNSSSTKNIQYTSAVSFDMDCIYDLCYEGTIKIGTVILKKGFIETNNKEQVQYFTDCLNNNSDKENETVQYLLKVDLVIQSPDASSHFLVVEPVTPLPFFFKQKLETFYKLGAASDIKREWWTYIVKSFRSIFRDILCAMYLIHSREQVIHNVQDKIYVTHGREGKILHCQEEEYSANRVKKDVESIVLSMKLVIASVKQSQDRTLSSEDWKMYGVPRELSHFFKSLEGVNSTCLPSTWLLDHPFFWDAKQRIHFIKSLSDVFREGLIDEAIFANCLRINGVTDWQCKVKRDPLLEAVYNYKGDSVYESPMGVKLVSFLNAFFSHANDVTHASKRNKALTPYDMEGKLANFLPDVYTDLFDAVSLYAKQGVGINFPKLLIALHRCSSLYSIKFAFKKK